MPFIFDSISYHDFKMFLFEKLNFNLQWKLSCTRRHHCQKSNYADKRRKVTSAHSWSHICAVKDHLFTIPSCQGPRLTRNPVPLTVKLKTEKTKHKTWTFISTSSAFWTSHIPFSKFYELFKACISSGRRIPLSYNLL